MNGRPEMAMTMELLGFTPRPLCPECGHAEHFHRANTADQRTKLDDPVPCFAVTGGAPPKYEHCGCAVVLPLMFRA